MPGVGLSAKGAMLAPPWGAGQQGPIRALRPQWEFAMSRTHPLLGWRSPVPPRRGRARGHVSGSGSWAAAVHPGQHWGCSRLCPARLLPAPAEPRGAAEGGARAPDWNHMEAHLQRIRLGASSSCLAGCAANLWGLSAPPRFPQRMFPGQSAAGLCAKLQPSQRRRR